METERFSKTGYELKLERRGLEFTPGMVITIHAEDPTEDREYSIASGIDKDHLRILYRYIPTGRLTSQLVELRKWDPVKVSGPYGKFTVRDPDRPMVFVATGTGIAPCRSFVRSFPDLDLTVIHGVRVPDDLFYDDVFADYRYHPCVSRGTYDGYQGRVTDFFVGVEAPADAHYYLCGAYEMIHDMKVLLSGRGVGDDAIFEEAYYYRSGD
jgi:ferredoxin--NADP+ reductase/benzoate/toluate 1,2-dioxygenase reductase subunit